VVLPSGIEFTDLHYGRKLFGQTFVLSISDKFQSQNNG
jgi:hypothetical protein